MSCFLFVSAFGRDDRSPISTVTSNATYIIVCEKALFVHPRFCREIFSIADECTEFI